MAEWNLVVPRQQGDIYSYAVLTPLCTKTGFMKAVREKKKCLDFNVDLHRAMWTDSKLAYAHSSFKLTRCSGNFLIGQYLRLFALLSETNFNGCRLYEDAPQL